MRKKMTKLLNICCTALIIVTIYSLLPSLIFYNQHDTRPGFRYAPCYEDTNRKWQEQYETAHQEFLKISGVYLRSFDGPGPTSIKGPLTVR